MQLFVQVVFPCALMKNVSRTEYIYSRMQVKLNGPSIYQFINQQGYLVECINDIYSNSTNIYLLLISPIKIKEIYMGKRQNI